MASETLSSLLDVQKEEDGADDMASRLVQDLDADGDGLLSLEEIASATGSDDAEALSAAVSKLDSDEDGKLSAGELDAGLEAAGPRRPPRPEGPPASADIAAKLIGDVDADGDEALSLDEVLKTLEAEASDALATAFGGLDTDGDGKLGGAELTSALDAFRAAGRREPEPGRSSVSA
jgi:Ca2+-binding EF-hand superfamily protein